ncbi:MAG: helix-turn-helix domain-containing protein, partial [Candidatus Adiutrix sp.]
APTDHLSDEKSLLPLPLCLEDLEKMAVGNALKHSGGNKSQAAHTLGVTRKTLASKLKKYGLD